MELKKIALDIFLGELSPAQGRELMKMRFLARKVTSENNVISEFLTGEPYSENVARDYAMTCPTRKGKRSSVSGLFRDTENRWKKLSLDQEDMAAKLKTYDNSEVWPDIVIDTSLANRINKKDGDCEFMMREIQRLRIH